MIKCRAKRTGDGTFDESEEPDPTLKSPEYVE